MNSRFRHHTNALAALLLLIPVSSCRLRPVPTKETAMNSASSSPVPVELTEQGIHDLEMKALGPGAWELRTTGDDPYVLTRPFPEPVDARRHPVLAFEYFCPSGIDSFQVFFGPAFKENRSFKAGKLGVAEGWVKQSVDLSQSPAWTGRIPLLRLDFGRHSGRSLRIRNMVLRAYNPRELELAASRAEREAAKKRLAADLTR